MARSAMLSILGLYLYDNTLFDGLQLPTARTDTITGVTTEAVDKDVLVDNLLLQLAELEVIYPDTDVMKEAIARWSATRIKEWDKLNLTLYLEWNPLYNYDRTEEWTDGENGSGNDSGSVEGSGTNTSTGSVAGFNSTSLVDNSKTAVSGNSTQSTTSSNSYNKNSTHSGNVKGNIGVTTSDQMVAQFRETVKFNIYDVIIDEFKQRFCLMVY